MYCRSGLGMELFLQTGPHCRNHGLPKIQPRAQVCLYVCQAYHYLSLLLFLFLFLLLLGRVCLCCTLVTATVRCLASSRPHRAQIFSNAFPSSASCPVPSAAHGPAPVHVVQTPQIGPESPPFGQCALLCRGRWSRGTAGCRSVPQPQSACSDGW